MKKNMGRGDQMLRLGLAVIIGILYYTNIITGDLTLVLLFVMGALLLTSLFSFCPMYAFFGFTTHKKSKYRKPPL